MATPPNSVWGSKGAGAAPGTVTDQVRAPGTQREKTSVRDEGGGRGKDRSAPSGESCDTGGLYKKKKKNSSIKAQGSVTMSMELN